MSSKRFTNVYIVGLLTWCLCASPVRASHPTTSTLDFGDRAGLLVIVVIACMSGAAVVLLLGYMALKALFGKQKYRPLRDSMVVYLVSLLMGDLLQSAGGMMSTRWVSTGLVEEGGFCKAQGVIQTLGEDATALSALAIAIYTFASICFNYKDGKDRRWVPWLVVTLVWTAVTLFVGAGYAAAHTSDYYGNVGLWCWITTDFFGQQIGLEYVWMWITALVNLVVYIPIAVCLCTEKSLGSLLKSAGPANPKDPEIGEFEFNPKTCRFVFARSAPPNEHMMVDLRMGRTVLLKGAIGQTSTRVENGRYIDLDLTASLGERRRVVARELIWFPLWYFVQVFPMAVVRFNYFRGHPPPTAATVFGSILFYASGLVNVLLCIFARRILFAGTDAACESESVPDITVTFNGDFIETRLADEENADGPRFLGPGGLPLDAPAAGAPGVPPLSDIAMMNMRRQQQPVGAVRSGTDDYSEARSERRAGTAISAFEPSWDREEVSEGPSSGSPPPQIAVVNMGRHQQPVGVRPGNDDASEAQSETRARMTISAFEPAWEIEEVQGQNVLGPDTV